MPDMQTELANIEYRRSEVSRRYLEGESQYEIAEALECNQSTVSRDLKFLRNQWRTSAASNFDKLQTDELAKIDWVEAEATVAWIRSKEDREISLTEEITGVMGTKNKTGSRREGQCGDSEFLRIIHTCIDKRCKMLGLDAPRKIALTNPDGTKEYGAEPRSRPLATLLDAVRAELAREEGPGPAADGAGADQPAVVDPADGTADVGVPEPS